MRISKERTHIRVPVEIRDLLQKRAAKQQIRIWQVIKQLLEEA